MSKIINTDIDIYTVLSQILNNKRVENSSVCIVFDDIDISQLIPLIVLYIDTVDSKLILRHNSVVSFKLSTDSFEGDNFDSIIVVTGTVTEEMDLVTRNTTKINRYPNG
jgi:hypothetical protein